MAPGAADAGSWIRAEARRRRPHLTISCVVAGLALAPAGTAIGAAAATVTAGVAWWCFGRRASACAATLVVAAALVGGLRLGAIDRPASAAPPGSAIDAIATLL